MIGARIAAYNRGKAPRSYIYYLRLILRRVEALGWRPCPLEIPAEWEEIYAAARKKGCGAIVGYAIERGMRPHFLLAGSTVGGYGGFVALALAIRHPKLVSRLVLCDAGAAFSQAGREMFHAMASMAQSHGPQAIADIAMRRLFAPDFRAAHPSLVAERRERFLAMGERVFITACRVLAELDLCPQLATVTVPVLAIVGEQDEATPFEMSQEVVAAVPEGRLVVIPGCAHVPQLQAPELFLQAVMPFLAVP